ncbi:MAG: NHL repeat-containing protein [Phycisphaerales bacterium]|nr:NHL repeat-containing protein [Phycisphaerales bacterium]
MTQCQGASTATQSGYAPSVWLGAPAPGGLALPSAVPASDTMYAPRGVWFDDERLIVSDSGNHRILIWNSIPTTDHAPADIVLGQPDFSEEGIKLFHLPTGVAVINGKFIVADSWHHRLLIWDSIPESNDTPPDHIIGQASIDDVEPNRGNLEATRDGFYWPYGFGVAGGRFFVADTGNRRVLGWPDVPSPGELPHWIIGQDDWTKRGENRDSPVGPLTFRWPHGIAGDDKSLYIADAGNHRVVGWSDACAACDGAEPDVVLGQEDFTSSKEWPYGPQAGNVHRFPYDVAMDKGSLAISDTANNRILIHDSAPTVGQGVSCNEVLAQPDFESNGENRWKSVLPDTLCWPYGLHFKDSTIAVADSGNNRVIIWKR